jgi:hypothetical protein
MDYLRPSDDNYHTKRKHSLPRTTQLTIHYAYMNTEKKQKFKDGEFGLRGKIGLEINLLGIL